MPFRLRSEDTEAIAHIEGYAELRIPLYDILAWPGLTLEQRGLAALLWTEMHRQGEPCLDVADISALIGVPVADLAALIDFPNAPFRLHGPAAHRVVTPSNLLAYGDAS